MSLASERDVAGGPDEILKAGRLGVLERRALGLSVVGQDDEPVGPRREPGCSLQPADLPVDAAQHSERVVPFDPGMVGHLVAHERRVDDGASGGHVVKHGTHDHVPRHDGGERA